jgi:RNA polymerase subunit RPABC4/transcription elongation factor Spt4
MQVKNETRSGFASEISIVPVWAWVLAGVPFVAAQWFFNTIFARDSVAPPVWARVPLGLLVGILGGGYCLFIGYINRDAKRRGMSPTLWTVVAVIIPDCLGILLYFILRHPRQSACPQCGSAVQAGFNFCPRCSYKLAPSCPKCQRIVGGTDVFCPYCATSLCTPAAPRSGLSTQTSG